MSWFDGFRRRETSPEQYREAWAAMLANEKPARRFGPWEYFEESGRVVHKHATDPNTSAPYTIWLDRLFDHHIDFVFARARLLVGSSAELERHLRGLMAERKKAREDNG